MDFLGMSKEQAKELEALYKAIDEAPYSPPCENFPDAYFADGGHDETNRLAKMACATCPVLNLCAAYGMRWETHGIWGGLTAGERRRLRVSAA